MRGSILESDVPSRQDVAISEKQSDIQRKPNTMNNEFRQESHPQHLPGSNHNHQQSRQVIETHERHEKRYLYQESCSHPILE